MSKKNKNEGLNLDALFTRPNRVAIVALGSSSHNFYKEQMSNRGMSNFFDEVWTVNRGFNAFRHDKLFAMDDFRWIEKHNKNYANYLKKHDKPIITSTVYPEYPTAVAYPVTQVMEVIEDDIFAMNTVSYMVAYSIYIRVKEVYLYGCDFSYPDGTTSEQGGQAVAYLCGIMRHFDMLHIIPGDSTLLYANAVKVQPNGRQARDLYGFHRIGQMAGVKTKEKKMKAARRATLKGK